MMRLQAPLFLCGMILIIALDSFCCQNVDYVYPMDTVEPIVRLSPARKGGVTNDRFGYSAVAHQIVEISDSDSYLTALNNTMIMVGAPNGRFPGGVTEIEPSGLACKDKYPTLSDSQLLELSRENITQSGCYDDLVTGLIYTCSFSSGDCTGTVGNNDSTGPDGLLFDRVGNTKRQKEDNIGEVTINQNKTGQLMGSMLYSTNDYFVACAPLWEYGGSGDVNAQTQSQPQGQCVYSPRKLSGFTIIQPCLTDSSNNQNLEAFCLLGSGIYISDNQSTFQFQNNPAPILAAGSPGRYYSSGGVFFFDRLDNLTDLEPGDAKPVYVPASHGMSPFIRKPYLTVNSAEQQTYYGFAVTSGYITNSDKKDFVASAPRWNEENQLGRVFIVTTLNAIPSIYVEGEQFGEYFGNSIEVADLNGDGWDDLIVSAPMYSKSSMPEIGRIYIFENMNGTLTKSSVIEGYAPFSRYGYSLSSLGDINDDGYQDFAVSAPYEGSGVVYIYYGQARDSTGSIVNTQYAQRIDGGSFVDYVSNITEVSTFGFSLSGKVDVDNNQYNDLVIGAYGSQTVFVLRSRPFANVNISSININTDRVSLISYQCTDNLGQPSSCFDISVCAEYNGKSLDNGFSTTFTLKENQVDPQQRLYFNNYTDYTITRLLQFSTPDTETCDSVTVYVLNSTLSLDFSDFQMIAEINPIQRPLVTIDTNSAPVDLSQYPYIVSDPVSFTVPVDSQCGDDDICDLDLDITYINTTYLGIDGGPFEEQSFLTLDAIARVDVYLSFKNIGGEDVFGYLIIFPLPRDVFIHRLVLPQSSFFTCNDTTPSNATHANLVCTDQQPFLSKSHGNTDIRFRWLVNNTLTGEVNTVSIPVTILPDPSDSRNRENITNNNEFLIDIDIRSQATYSTTLQFARSAVTYQGNHTPTVNSNASNLGEQLRLSATIENQGPSTIYNAKFVIYIPINSSETGNYYYFYPAVMQVTSGNINCMDTLNPDRYTNVSLASGNQRKRSLINHQERSLYTAVLNRQIRQDSNSNLTYNLDCMANPDQCLTLMCNVSDIVGAASLDIYGFIDERFYNRKSDIYLLRAYAVVNILDTFINTTGSNDLTTDTLSLSRFNMGEEDRTIPWYYIAPPAVGGFLIIVILAIILYFVGFFNRKKHHEGGQDGTGVDQFVDNPFGDGAKPTSIAKKSTED